MRSVSRKLSCIQLSQARIEVLELVDADSHAADSSACGRSLDTLVSTSSAKYARTEDRFPLYQRLGFVQVLLQSMQIYGIIATDDLWHNLTVLKSAGESVDSYFLNQLTTQKFRPAQCGNTPVEFENVLGIEYRP
jgi:hypothetical protein